MTELQQAIYSGQVSAYQIEAHRVAGDLPIVMFGPSTAAQPVEPATPYAYAVYFPDQPCIELVHDLDDLSDDMTNRAHTITNLYDHAPSAQPVRPAFYQYQTTNGNWHNFIDDEHQKNTVADGRWPIRALYTSPQVAQPVQPAEQQSQDALDAARYRWLRDTNLTRPDMTDGSRVILAPNEVISIWHGLPENEWDLMGGCLRCAKGNEFDTAIDAAIAARGAT